MLGLAQMKSDPFQVLYGGNASGKYSNLNRPILDEGMSPLIFSTKSYWPIYIISGKVATSCPMLSGWVTGTPFGSGIVTCSPLSFWNTVPLPGHVGHGNLCLPTLRLLVLSQCQNDLISLDKGFLKFCSRQAKVSHLRELLRGFDPGNNLGRAHLWESFYSQLHEPTHTILNDVQVQLPLGTAPAPSEPMGSACVVPNVSAQPWGPKQQTLGNFKESCGSFCGPHKGYDWPWSPYEGESLATR